MLSSIINLVLVRRDNLEKYWWHRFANVLIYTTTLAVIYAPIPPLHQYGTYSVPMGFAPGSFVEALEKPDLESSDVLWIMLGTTTSFETLTPEQIKGLQNAIISPADKLFSNLTYGLRNGLLWFLFWQSFVYRALVYIILGARRR